MKFCEAIEKLKNGKRITRNSWKDEVYFMMADEGIISLKPRDAHYMYDQDIMVSNGWIIEGEQEEKSFCDIIFSLQGGKKAKRSEWEDKYIYLDRVSKIIIVHTMEESPFTPDFESFMTSDWIEL